MRKLIPAALLVVGLSSEYPAFPQAGPASGWGVERTEHECLLFQQTKSSSSQYIAVKMIPGATFVDLILVNPSKRASEYRTKRFEVLLRPNEVRETGEGYRRTFRDRPAIWVSLKPGFVKRLAKAESLSVTEQKGARRFGASVSGMEQAAEMLRQCHDGFLRAWGIEPAEISILRDLPEPPGRTGVFFNDKDYPLEAMRANASGTVLTRLLVGAAGTVERCDIIRSSGNKQLDDKTCEVFVSRGRFKPAVAASGQPTAATIVARTIWALPS